jgi:hypothetical protein
MNANPPTDLYVQESFVNRTKNLRYGDDSVVYATGYDHAGKLFRALRKEYGRCTGHVYIDTADPQHPQKIGWVFVKRQTYSNSRETYLQEVWVTVHTAPPTRTVTYHYATLK